MWLAKATHKRVVSYRNSTSNHNLDRHFGGQRVVVSYRNSTSNHNNKGLGFVPAWLYLIEILHQTTTIVCTMTFDRRCILSKFYIKPQRRVVLSLSTIGCILSKFYIKPQRRRGRSCGVLRCILSKFYIKPQPFEWYPVEIFGCILSKFYIKPQPHVAYIVK